MPVYESPKPAPYCVLCEREVSRTTRHHLIPRRVHKNKWFKQRFTRQQMNQTIDLCVPCHKQVHVYISHKELARTYHSLEKLQSHPQLKKYLDWVKRRG